MVHVALSALCVLLTSRILRTSPPLTLLCPQYNVPAEEKQELMEAEAWDRAKLEAWQAAKREEMTQDPRMQNRMKRNLRVMKRYKPQAGCPD